MRLSPLLARPGLFPIALLLAIAPGCKGTLVTEHRVEVRKADYEGVTLLEVRNLKGDIEVIAYRHIAKELEVTATYTARADKKEKARADLDGMKLRIHRDGSKATVLVDRPASKGARDHAARLRILVPADSALDADTGEGNIRVLGLGGAITVRSGRGNLEVMGAQGHAQMETKRGDLKLTGDFPSFDVSTSRGEATVLMHERSSLESPSSIMAKRGDVHLSLSESFNGQLSLQTKELVFVTPFSSLKRKGNTWAGTLGSGGKLLSVSAPKGSLRLVARPYIKLQSSPQFRDGERRGQGGGGPKQPPPPPNDDHGDDEHH
ncbi:MAG: hypothetical protein RBU30_05020 [Polyangia bacterium]|jgi:hypothetical protein|nr:hypothetical protein [Polyangia bacterium]